MTIYPIRQGGMAGGEVMRSLTIKLGVSALLVILAVSSLPFIGLTTSAEDDATGVIIDFGYWDVVWTEMTFQEDWDAVRALEEACDMNSLPLVFSDETKTHLVSINGQLNLYGVTWGLYVIDDEGLWKAVEDYHSVNAYDEGIICWARSSGPDSVIPATDQTGFNYYGYARDGISLKSNEPLRVVSLAPSITETVAAVGGVDYLVGTDYYSNYPQEVVDRQNSGKIEIVGGYTDPNYEWIINADPDIVICDGGTGEHVSMANKLRKSGVDCVVLYNATDVEKLYDNMWIVASAMGVSGNANKAITSAKNTIDVVTSIAGFQVVERVFASLGVEPSPWTSGSDTFLSDLIGKAGGVNVFDASKSSWFMVNKEQIHKNDPSAIVIIYDSREITTEEEYQAIIDNLDPLWKETRAYRNGEIYIFSGDSADILSRPGPRLAQAAELLAKAFYPDNFLDRDPLDSVPQFFGDDYEQYLKYQYEAS